MGDAHPSDRATRPKVAGQRWADAKKATGRTTLELIDHGFGAGGAIFARRFDIHLFNDAVVDDQRQRQRAASVARPALRLKSVMPETGKALPPIVRALILTTAVFVLLGIVVALPLLPPGTLRGGRGGACP